MLYAQTLLDSEDHLETLGLRDAEDSLQEILDLKAHLVLRELRDHQDLQEPPEIREVEAHLE